jgi:hypothetical protein
MHIASIMLSVNTPSEVATAAGKSVVTAQNVHRDGQKVAADEVLEDCVYQRQVGGNANMSNVL